MDTNLEVLKSIIQPHAEEIATCREKGGIVFVVHKPGTVARQALTVLGCANPPPSVFALPCADAARAFRKGQATAAWLQAPPVDGQIKIFLISGEGTALLTLNFGDDGVRVDVESQTGDLN